MNLIVGFDKLHSTSFSLIIIFLFGDTLHRYRLWETVIAYRKPFSMFNITFFYCVYTSHCKISIITFMLFTYTLSRFQLFFLFVAYRSSFTCFCFIFFSLFLSHVHTYTLLQFLFFVVISLQCAKLHVIEIGFDTTKRIGIESIDIEIYQHIKFHQLLRKIIFNRKRSVDI